MCITLYWTPGQKGLINSSGNISHLKKKNYFDTQADNSISIKIFRKFHKKFQKQSLGGIVTQQL